MRVELRTRPAVAVVVADVSAETSEVDAWLARCACGLESLHELEDDADTEAMAHRAVCRLRMGDLVGRATLPPFNAAPSVLFLGDRVFLPRPLTEVEEASQRLRGDPLLVYEEAAFAYAVTSLDKE